MLEGRGCKRGDEVGNGVDVVADVEVEADVLVLLGALDGAAVLALTNVVRSHTAVDIDPEDPRNM